MLLRPARLEVKRKPLFVSRCHLAVSILPWKQQSKIKLKIKAFKALKEHKVAKSKQLKEVLA